MDLVLFMHWLVLVLEIIVSLLVLRNVLVKRHLLLIRVRERTNDLLSLNLDRRATGLTHPVSIDVSIRTASVSRELVWLDETLNVRVPEDMLDNIPQGSVITSVHSSFVARTRPKHQVERLILPINVFRFAVCSQEIGELCPSEATLLVRPVLNRLQGMTHLRVLDKRFWLLNREELVVVILFAEIVDHGKPVRIVYARIHSVAKQLEHAKTKAEILESNCMLQGKSHSRITTLDVVDHNCSSRLHQVSRELVNVGVLVGCDGIKVMNELTFQSGNNFRREEHHLEVIVEHRIHG